MDLTKSPLSFPDLLAKIAKAVPTDSNTTPNSRLEAVFASMSLLTKSYRPWRTLKHIARDAGLDPEHAWHVVKLFRGAQTRLLRDLVQADGAPFHFSFGGHLIEPLHRIDRTSGGGGPAALDPDEGVLGDADQRARIRIRTLMDEAAESSIIEGASSTRKDAVELLRSGKAPTKRGERMIVNNYLAMSQIKELTRKPLSLDMLCNLQRTLTDGTLHNAEESGRLRRLGEKVDVIDERDQSVIYTPPPANLLENRLERLFTFANKDHTDDDFIHPIVKASILHFMIGYEHPFCDGNGRTARAVFYWYALKHGYNIFEYLAISELIRKGFAKYPQAYIDTEQDGGDLTYFILYKLDIIEQSLDRFAQYIRKEEQKVRQSAALLKVNKNLSLRQRLLLEHALRHPTTNYTVKSHMNSNGITANTARGDLNDLVKNRLMIKSRKGQEIVYNVIPDLAKRIDRER